MKKLNKGFAISGIIYSILILFLLLIFSILAILGSRKLIIDKFKLDVLNKIYGNELEKEEVVYNDINLAFEYIGEKEKPEKLPGKGEGYYVQSVSCQNGTAKWSNELWALTNVESENKQIMSCELTLGDDETYDDTIDQSFENLKPENVVSGVQIGDVTGEASGGTFLIARGPKLTDVGLGGQYATQIIAKSADVIQSGNSYTLPPGEYSMILEGRVNGRGWQDSAYGFAIQCWINSSFVVNYTGQAPAYSPRTTRKEYNFSLDAPGTISAFVKQDSNMVSYQDSYVMIAVVKTR